MTNISHFAHSRLEELTCLTLPTGVPVPMDHFCKVRAFPRTGPTTSTSLPKTGGTMEKTSGPLLDGESHWKRPFCSGQHEFPLKVCVYEMGPL